MLSLQQRMQKLESSLHDCEADKATLARDVEAMLAWAPSRIVIAHGRCAGKDARAMVEYAFRKVLRTHRWEAAMEAYEEKTGGPQT